LLPEGEGVDLPKEKSGYYGMEKINLAVRQAGAIFCFGQGL
jgi:hypothetical protein